MRGGLVIISGPSGIGKDTILDTLPSMLDRKCHRVRTLTTRRQATNHDQSYDCVSDEEFTHRTSSGRWITNRQCSGSYATDIDEIDRAISQGNLCLHNVFPSNEGVGALRPIFRENLLSIAMIPPGSDEEDRIRCLRERLTTRNREGDNIEHRLSHFKQIMSYILSEPIVKIGDKVTAPVFNSIVENNHFEDALRHIIQKIQCYFNTYATL